MSLVWHQRRGYHLVLFDGVVPKDWSSRKAVRSVYDHGVSCCGRDGLCDPVHVWLLGERSLPSARPEEPLASIMYAQPPCSYRLFLIGMGTEQPWPRYFTPDWRSVAFRDGLRTTGVKRWGRRQKETAQLLLEIVADSYLEFRFPPLEVVASLGTRTYFVGTSREGPGGRTQTNVKSG